VVRHPDRTRPQKGGIKAVAFCGRVTEWSIRC